MKKIIFSLFLLLAVRVLAVSPVPYTESVSFSFKISGTGVASMNLFDENGSQYILASASGSTIESAMGAASLRPGKTYSLEFWGDGPSDYRMSFIPPTGYSVYVNGVATDLVGQSPGGGWFLHYYTVEIRPSGSTGGGMWGSFSGISQGKSITWEVGLGDLRTGRGAGSILFKELDLSNSPASRSRLYYAAPPANVGQIVVIKDGASNQTLRQIVTPIGFTDIVNLDTNNPAAGYEIRCYFWAQVEPWNGTLYTFSGSPWKKIKVESPATNQLKITETEGSVVRVSLLTGSGSTSNTGGTISYAGNNTVHTFTSGGTLAVNSALSSVSYLVVAGGGGGGYGGGGAGSVEYLTGQSIAAGSHTVTVGAGGAAETNGSNSTFNGTTAYGGGRGAGASTAPGSGGSSGGGCANNNTGGPPNSGSGSNIHWGGGGDNGGNGWRSGGGGGAGGDGLGLNNSSGASQGTGGPGLANSITGPSVIYAGGGSGNSGSPLAGGAGGGGGSNGSGQTGSAGATNTGSGGGGGDNGSGPAGGAGGSGVVIVRYPTPTMTWTLQEGDSTNCARTTVHTITYPASGQRDDVAAVYTTTGTYASPTNTLVAKTKYHYVNQAWGEELDSIIADPDTAALTTSYTYHTTSSNKGNYRLLKSITAPTGGWTAYEYYDDWDRRGRVKYQFQPWLDTPSTASGASATAGHVFYYEYTTDWTGRYARPTLRQEYITVSGTTTTVGKTTWSHGDNTGSGEPRAYATINFYRDVSNNYHSDYTESYRADADPDFVGQLYQVKGANLAQVSGSVSRGTFNTTTKAFSVGSSGDHWRELKFNGSTTSSTGADSVTAFDGQSCPAVFLIRNKSTVDVTIRIAQGYVYRVEKWVYTGVGGSGFSLLTNVDYEYDAYGHPYQEWASNGALTHHAYTNGRHTSTTDPTGIETQYTYDLIGRVATSIKKGASASGSYSAQGDITNTYTYDGAGRLKQTVSSGGSLSQTATSNYDLAGRITQTVAPGSYTTGFAYSSGGKIVTATLPGGATRIDEVYLDGQAKSQTGTAVVASHFSYPVNTSPGTITRQVNFNTSNSTAQVKATADWLGRTITEEKPAGSGSGTVTVTSYYNGSGQLYKVTRPGLADTLYVYDTMGILSREGLDVGGTSGTLDDASSDRITDNSWTYFPDGSNWWRRDAKSGYATTSSGTATQLGKVETQLSGLPSNRLSRTNTSDIFGNVTSQFVDVNRSGKIVTTTADLPDSTTDVVTTAYNGLVVSARNAANHTATFEFDALGRVIKSIDPRTAGSGSGSPFGTVTAYMSGTNQTYTVTDPAGITQATYEYDNAGRVSRVAVPNPKHGIGGDTRPQIFSRYTYTDRNEKYREWGDTTYPVEYGYDDWGRRITMKTYRGGSGWGGDNWPSSPGTPDTAMWNFNEPTGLLASKVSAYGTSDAKTVSYTYTQDGQIHVRTWARGVTTTYGYSSTTSELLTVTYSGTTPSLTYTYNRLGQLNSATQNGTTTIVTSFDRCVCGKVITEYLDSNFYGGRQINHDLHPTADGTKGRTMGYELKQGSTVEQALVYGYDTYGRPNFFKADTVEFGYAYATNSNLIASINQTTSGWSQTRSYLPNRNLLDVVETKISTTPKAKFDHTHDVLGRVQDVTKTGELFEDYGSTSTKGLKTTYGYNDRSELTSEDTADLASTPVAINGRQVTYSYDNIGNRTSVTKSRPTGNAGGNLSFNYNVTSPTGYEINALNQYKRRTVPGIYDLAAISTASSIAVSGVSSGSGNMAKQDNYFFRGHPMNNSNGPVYDALTIGGATPPHDAVLPPANENFGYDDDGNLLTDGRWTRTYDAENRLIAIETNSVAYGAGVPRQKIEFRIDYLGRRTGKTVYHYASGWVFDSETRYVYNDWNIIEELAVNSSGTTIAKLRTYAWGLDLSGARQGAGGVGGLLMTKNGNDTYLPMFDGNGNMHGLINSSDGSLAAEYEFDAFGNNLREFGTFAATNPWRFSTKFTDIETGEVNYGFRVYLPSLGRFANKDPLEEQGGLNLYAFVRNNSINLIDRLGLDDMTAGSIDDYWSWRENSRPDLGETVTEMERFVVTGNQFEAVAHGIKFDTLIHFIDKTPADLSKPSTDNSGGDPSANDPTAANATNKTEEGWKPNKADCDGLRNSYPTAFMQPNGRSGSLLNTAIAATIRAGSATGSVQTEHSSIVYRNPDGTFGYSLPVPVNGSDYGGGGVPFNNPEGSVALMIAHGHNIGTQAFVVTAVQRGTPVRAIPQDQESWYIASASNFSSDDRNTAKQYNPILMFSPTGETKAYSPLNPNDTNAGHTVPGSPPATDAVKISRCISAGL